MNNAMNADADTLAMLEDILDSLTEQFARSVFRVDVSHPEWEETGFSRVGRVGITEATSVNVKL